MSLRPHLGHATKIRLTPTPQRMQRRRLKRGRINIAPRVNTMENTTTAGGPHTAIATTLTSAPPWPAAAPGPVPREGERLRGVHRGLLGVGDHCDVGVEGSTRMAGGGGIVPVTTLRTGAACHLSLSPTPVPALIPCVEEASVGRGAAS
jgi:hypothetical protein